MSSSPRATTPTSRRVAVTAVGIVSPLGKNVPHTLASLKAGLDCVSPVTQFDVTKTKSSTAGQVPGCYLEDIASESRAMRRLHRASHMMIAATREALSQVPGWSPEDRPSESRAMPRLHRASHMMIAATREALSQVPGFAPQLAVIGTTSGGMTYGENFFKSHLRHTSQKHNATWLANYF